jgi:hypothetical protein
MEHRVRNDIRDSDHADNNGVIPRENINEWLWQSVRVKRQVVLKQL